MLGTAEFVGFGISGYYFFTMVKEYQSIIDSLEFMERATVFSPKMLKDAMRCKGIQTYRTRMLDFEESKDCAIAGAFVEGKIISDNPIRSSLLPNTNLIARQTSEETIFSSTGEVLETGTSMHTKITPSISITDGRESVLLQGSKRIKLGLALRMIETVTIVNQWSGTARILQILTRILKLLFSMSSMSGGAEESFELSQRRIEKGILLGQQVVAFGRILYDRTNNTLRMDNPEYLLKSKSDLISLMKTKSNSFYKNLIGLSLMFLLFMFLVHRRVRRLIELYRERKSQQDQKMRTDKLYKISSFATDDFKCIKCKLLARNVIYKPCMHMLICSACFQDDKKINKTCPYCIEEVLETVEIYAS